MCEFQWDDFPVICRIEIRYNYSHNPYQLQQQADVTWSSLCSFLDIYIYIYMLHVEKKTSFTSLKIRFVTSEIHRAASPTINLVEFFHHPEGSRSGIEPLGTCCLKDWATWKNPKNPKPKRWCFFFERKKKCTLIFPPKAKGDVMFLLGVEFGTMSNVIGVM